MPKPPPDAPDVPAVPDVSGVPDVPAMPEVPAGARRPGTRGSGGSGSGSWLSVAAAALGAACAAFVGGVVLKTMLPSPSTIYPLTSFGQVPQVLVRVNETTTPPPPAPRETAKGWEVYFPHGSATLTDEQQKWLARLSTLLGECEVLRLNLTGLVSSAKYPPPSSDDKNLRLAHARADFVRSFMAERTPKAKLETYTWQDYSALDTRRYFRDLRRDERIENAAEFLNRRVDIELARESRCPSMVQTLAAPLVAKPGQAMPAATQ